MTAHRRWPLLAFIVLFVFPGIVVAQPSETPSEQESPPADVAVAKEIAATTEPDTDEQLSERISEILNETGWIFDAEVNVRHGVAHLYGRTDTLEQKRQATQVAEHVEGIAAVVNSIEIRRSVDLGKATDLMFKSLNSLWQDFMAHMPLIVAGLIALFLTAIINRAVRAVLRRLTATERLRSSLQDLILQLATIGVWIVGLLIAAVIVFPGLTPAKALTVLGLGSIAIGFAFKDIFENFFAGLLILWKYPFDRGDFVSCGSIMGKIEDITIRNAMIRQVDGELIVVPNAVLFKEPVDIVTSQPVRRTTIICGVAYDTDLDHAQSVIRNAVEQCDDVDADHPVEVFAQEFAASSINFEVTWWTGSTPVEIRRCRDEVVRAVKTALDDAEIVIPFPQRTLWLPEAVKLDGPRNGSALPHENGVTNES